MRVRHRRQRRAFAASALLLPATLLAPVTPAAAAESQPSGPGGGGTPVTDGLEAWYRTVPLARGLQNGEVVTAWPDASGNGHDLTSDANGLPAVYHASQLRRHGVVEVRAGNSYSVAEPFTLAEHTIFLVYQSGGADRALFRSASDPHVGLVLRAGGRHDHLQPGATGTQDVKPYGTASAVPGAYAITVLGRERTALKAFIDGVDVSSNQHFPDPIEVGTLFHLQQSRFARTDGAGLWIAEMLFYDRYLSEIERNRVTVYLAERYGIDVAVYAPPPDPEPVVPVVPAPSRPIGVVQLSTSIAVNLNDPIVAVPWTVADVIDSPFRHLPDDPTRLYCDRDGVRVRLYAAVPVETAAPGTRVNVLFRVNGAKFLRGGGVAVPAGVEAPYRDTARAEVLTLLRAGDYVEVVAIGEGAPGAVTIVPEAGVFVAETR